MACCGERVNDCKQLTTRTSEWLHVVLVLTNFIFYVPFFPPPPLPSFLVQDIVTHKLKPEEIVKGIELVNNSRESVKVVLLPE